MSHEFRVVTNGKIFRVQRSEQRKFLFWTWTRWLFLCHITRGWTCPIDFPTEAVALRRASSDVADEYGIRHPWMAIGTVHVTRPVKDRDKCLSSDFCTLDKYVANLSTQKREERGKGENYE